MIGAKMIADGAMGKMTREVWSEGDLSHEKIVAPLVMESVLSGIQTPLQIELKVDGSPRAISIDPGSDSGQVLAKFEAQGAPDHVQGMIAHAIFSHLMSAGNGKPLTIQVDL